MTAARRTNCLLLIAYCLLLNESDPLMRRLFIICLCLSLPVLSGCRSTMRTETEQTEGAVRVATTVEAAELTVASDSETGRAAASVETSAEKPPFRFVEQSGWRPTADSGQVIPVSQQTVEPATDDQQQAADEGEPYPLNLTTALQLAGGNNLQIALASERIQAAVAKLDGASVLWLPSLNAGAGFNSHTGQIQATNGELVEVDRQSVFVGGGPVLGTGPLAGGAGGPMRMMANLNPVDAWFEPLAEQQLADAAEADHTAVYNEMLYRVTVAWLNLQSAQSHLTIANEAIEHSQKLAGLTREFSDAGAGLEADALRAASDLAERERMKLAAEEERDVASAELARLLRLPMETPLEAVDAQPIPMEIVDAEVPLAELISQGVTHRPELHRQDARTEAAKQRATQEMLRPWLPKLQAGLSAGGFGGGRDSEFSNLDSRVDIDALAIWELRNLGFGNAAMLAERESQHRQESLTMESFQDQVAAEVVQARARVEHRRLQIDTATAQLKAAQAALPLNFDGIEGHVLRPIEAQQAISDLANARRRHLDAIVGYNEAQFALLRAVGEPPQSATVE